MPKPVKVANEREMRLLRTVAIMSAFINGMGGDEATTEETAVFWMKATGSHELFDGDDIAESCEEAAGSNAE